MLDLNKIGNKIANRRKELNMTQNELASALYVTHQAVSKWENGKSIPAVEVLVTLTKVLNLTIDYLLDHSEIDEFDYELLFKNYPREIVFNKLLSQMGETTDLTTFFYLLNKDERKQYVLTLLNRNLCQKIKNIWPYLTVEERYLVIVTVKDSDCEFEFKLIQKQLTNQERILINRRTI